MIDPTPFVIGEDISVSPSKLSYTDATLTALPKGGFVVAWTGQFEGAGSAVFAQVFDPKGGATSEVIELDAGKSKMVSAPSITALSDGGFVATYMSADQDGSGSGVFGQRFDAEGVRVGEEFQVNTETKGDQGLASVTSLADGGFVVTWASDVTNSDIRAQLFDKDAKPIGEEIAITALEKYGETNPTVTALGKGGFAVAWMSENQDGEFWGVYGQCFNADGKPTSEPFLANTHVAGDQGMPELTALADGGFVVTWMSSEQDGSGYGVYGQRYSEDGKPVGEEFQVNTQTKGNQGQASLASLPDGGFVVAWTSEGQDGSGYGVFAQRFDREGKTVGSEFQINGFTEGDQITNPLETSLVTLADGHLALTYYGDGGTHVRIIEVPDLAPPANANPVLAGGDSITASTAENTTAVVQIAASDTDAGDTLSFSVVGGADAALFRIDAASGVLTFHDAPDFDSPQDTGKDNVYNVTVAVSDGRGGLDAQDIAVSVTNVKGITSITSNAPVITGTGEEDTLAGQYSNNTLNGLGGNDTLSGGAGNDTLDGGLGADVMRGGQGNDTFIVDDAGDQIVELAKEGTDVVKTQMTSLSLAKFDNVEDLTYTGKQDFSGTGNALANRITSGIGNDHLDGGAGGDRMTGGAGDDTYVISDIGDMAVEQAGGGTDTVLVGGKLMSHMMSSNVENLVYTGSYAVGGKFIASGNILANTMTGGTGADMLDGKDGADTLYGLGGADRLTGGAGRDHIIGGGGNDTMYGGTESDTFDFGAASGKDTINDFTAKGADHDVLAFDRDLFSSTADVIAHSRQVGRNVVITIDASDTITLLNVSLQDLKANADHDFVFI